MRSDEHYPKMSLTLPSRVRRWGRFSTRVVRFQFVQQIALPLVQLARSLHPHFDIQVAFAVAIQNRYAFALMRIVVPDCVPRELSERARLRVWGL